jgi:hypothetical protein
MTAATPDRRAIITEALHKIDDLTARLEIAEKSGTEPIAVIGMGCRFPGGVNNPDQFWDLLCAGRSGIVRVPADRWDADAFYTDDHTVTLCRAPFAIGKAGFSPAGSRMSSTPSSSRSPHVKRPQWTRNSGC